MWKIDVGSGLEGEIIVLVMFGFVFRMGNGFE